MKTCDYPPKVYAWRSTEPKVVFYEGEVEPTSELIVGLAFVAQCCMFEYHYRFTYTHLSVCYAMLCYAMLCYAVLCCAVLCCATLCCAVLHYAVLCCAALCYAMPCDVPCLVLGELPTWLPVKKSWGVACFWRDFDTKLLEPWNWHRNLTEVGCQSHEIDTKLTRSWVPEPWNLHTINRNSVPERLNWHRFDRRYPRVS